jgi:hypothetical protein
VSLNLQASTPIQKIWDVGDGTGDAVPASPDQMLHIPLNRRYGEFSSNTIVVQSAYDSSLYLGTI